MVSIKMMNNFYDFSRKIFPFLTGRQNAQISDFRVRNPVIYLVGQALQIAVSALGQALSDHLFADQPGDVVDQSDPDFRALISQYLLQQFSGIWQDRQIP